jgi:hypothetical protein
MLFVQEKIVFSYIGIRSSSPNYLPYTCKYAMEHSPNLYDPTFDPLNAYRAEVLRLFMIQSLIKNDPLLGIYYSAATP